MDSRMNIYRITDFLIPCAILNNETIASVIYEDGAAFTIPDVVNNYWLGIDIGKYQTIGCYQFNPVSAIMWEIHIRILPQFRKEYAVNATRLALTWAADNIKDLHKVIGYIPEVFGSAIAHCIRVGMTQEAYLAESYLRDSKIVGQQLFSITIEKIRRLQCQ